MIYVAEEQGGKTPGLFAFESTRNMLFTTEPAGVSVLIASTILLAGSIYRRYILPIVSLPLLYLISQSNTLVVASFSSLFFLIILRSRHKFLNFLFGLIILVLAIHFFLPFLKILGNSFEQFESLQNKNFGISSISLFPVSTDNMINVSSYGILNILPRFGLIVSFFSFFLFSYMFYFMSIAYNKKYISIYDFFTFSYIFIASLRIDNFFNPFIYLLFFYYSKKLIINNKNLGT